ncbi:hypothetical protein QR680_015955 [Steinernema hermaphroditum]|uniref:G-protein coupled receptors family 1 profile domain-containing protein n=1 Tax=Steinernema hermaphroditum TaxID=289476 RepID=A0AA39HAH6_9BILA|nr:hypothetical protein QR680_015955 [Steinernema hermaphroditum]
MFPGYLVAMLGVYSIVFIVGVVGNVWVLCTLWLILSDHGKTSSSLTFRRISLYVFALSIVDLHVLLMIPMLGAYFYTGSWPFGYVACKIFWTIENVNKLLSVAILIAMTFERYMGVCRPFSNFQRGKMWNYTNGFIAISFVLFIFLLCSPIIYYAGITEHVILKPDNTIHERVLFCTSDLPDFLLPYFIMYMFIVGFVLPVVLMVVFYTLIIKRLKTTANTSVEDAPCKKTPTEKRLRRKISTYNTQRVVRSILWVVIFHFVCWTPFWAAVLLTLMTTSNLAASLEIPVKVLMLTKLVTSFLPYINSAGNWIFYAALNREIQITSRELRLRQAQRMKKNSVIEIMMHRAFFLLTLTPRESTSTI